MFKQGPSKDNYLFARLDWNISLHNLTWFIILHFQCVRFSVQNFCCRLQKMIFPKGKATSRCFQCPALASPLQLVLNYFKRNSKIAMNEWRTKIDKELFDRVQLDCETMMKDFGYKHYQTVEELKRNLDEPYFTS